MFLRKLEHRIKTLMSCVQERIRGNEDRQIAQVKIGIRTREMLEVDPVSNDEPVPCKED
jgi:hypothetical protein